MVSTRTRPSSGGLVPKQTVKAKVTPVAATSAKQRTSFINKSLTKLQANSSVKESVSTPTHRLTALERENAHFKRIIDELRSELNEQKNQIILLQRERNARDNGISLEQEEINNNIVVRGIEINSDSSPESLSAAFSGLCAHLGVENVPEFIPEALEIVPALNNKSQTASRPLRVRFKSVSAKRNFLQVRRAKRDIFPSNIGIAQTSRAPLRIDEQLTRSNQELLYQARSLRGKNNYKYVWSNNGQILARKQDRSRVVRIRDFDHLNELLHLAVLPINNGHPNVIASRTRTPLRNGSCHQEQ